MEQGLRDGEQGAHVRPALHDLFAALEQPRRPWLEEAALRDAFHRHAANQHPDLATGDSDTFTKSNRAFATLRDPVKRLRHLLELENPEALSHAGTIPSDLAELFPQIGAARLAMLALATHRRAATTALSRALLGAEEAAARATADRARAALDVMRSAAFETLRELDAEWPSESTRAALPELHRRLAFLSRWDEQLREAALACELG